MMLVELFVGAEDYGRRWVVRLMLLGLLIEIGETHAFRLIVALGLAPCLGGWYRQWAFILAANPTRRLGPLAALGRSLARTFEGWRAGRYVCTRCGKSEIAAKRDGCKRGPCPMELKP